MLIPYKINHVGIEPWEEYPAAAGTYKVGDALKLTDGELGAGGAAPTHVCMATKAAKEGELLPCIPVDGDVIWECKASEAATYTAATVIGEVGDKAYLKF